MIIVIIDIQYNFKFEMVSPPEVMKVILVKSPNNEGDRVPTGHLLSPNKAFITGTGLYSIELWAKGAPPNITGYCQGC